VIGMSGLLVKSTVVMKENLEEMNQRGVAEKYPVLLGGAALTRAYVEHDLSEVYAGDVRYARDAFEGLRLMDALMAARRGSVPAAATPDGAGEPNLAGAVGTAEEDRKRAERKARRERSLRIAAQRRAAEEAEEATPPGRSDVATDNPVPTPPFWGSRVVKGIQLADYATLLTSGPPSSASGGLRGARGGKGPSYEELVETEGRPRLRYWLDRFQDRGHPRGRRRLRLLPGRQQGRRPDRAARRRHRAGPVHLPAAAPGPAAVPGRLLPRGRTPARPTWSPSRWPRWASAISEFTAELFAANAYRDYLEVHGLSVQLTEALAEHWHARVREELGFSGEDPDDVEEFFKLGYRGARYSFGYPACPDLENQQQVRELLDFGRIGVELSEEFQLHPEQSTSAIVVHHPEAKYFAT
jgi:5-methyltetrahydrofolate--homocysteine methyltransferase